MKRAQTPTQGPRTQRCRGVAIVEGAIVLPVLMIVVLGMLDLSLLVLESNTLAEASRRMCRQAMVHGQMASPQMTVWGPASVTGTANDGTEYAEALNPELVTFDLNQVSYVINWPDGGNLPGNRVQVTVNYQYKPLMPLVLGTNSVPITMETTMEVAH
jgi:Flp pilus assembly protein TadG